MIGIIAFISSVFIGMVFIAAIVYLLFRGFFNLIGLVVYQAYKYLTYTLPHSRTGRLQDLKRQEEETKELKKATEKMRVKKIRDKELNEIVKAAINRAIYLQNKFPYVNDTLIDKYVISFSKCTMAQLESIEAEIKVNHERNALFNLNAQKTYTMTDLRDKVPYQQKFEYPFEMRAFQIGADYVLHFRDKIQNSDSLIQTQNKSMIDKYFKDYEEKVELLRTKFDIIYNNR